ncbi:cellular tumor antigen p53 isoform X2 [Contarinia nasturtii]|nr:cellular tumor antigen p53 isoform X2 [Contarinia nasturtii]
MEGLVKGEFPPEQPYHAQHQMQQQMNLQMQIQQQQHHPQQQLFQAHQPVNDQLLEQQLAQMPFMSAIAGNANPPHFAKHPNLTEINTNYDFTVGVPPDQANNVVFSQQKLFIKMDSKMTFCVTYREQVKDERLFLRVMILYSSTENMHLPVNRCANHQYRQSNEEIQQNNAIVDKDARFASIIKINNPAAMYRGKKTGETFGERLSVIIPLDSDEFDADGNITQLICMEFGCQNSCTSGINRRPTTLVFTLENEFYHLLGKGTIEFKVCSCPKRDAEREKEAPKGKRNLEKACPRGKRPKYSEPARMVKTEPESESDNNDGTSNDTKSVSMTQLTITVPTELVAELLRDAQAKVALKLFRDGKNHVSQYEACLKELRKIEKCNEKK